MKMLSDKEKCLYIDIIKRRNKQKANDNLREKDINFSSDLVHSKIGLKYWWKPNSGLPKFGNIKNLNPVRGENTYIRNLTIKK